MAGGAQELMWLGPFQDAGVRAATGRVPYISQAVQEVILKALSDEEATMLYASIAFAFGSPPDVGPNRANQHVVGGSITQGGAPMNYG